jgi:hypothetical protein
MGIASEFPEMGMHEWLSAGEKEYWYTKIGYI